MSVMPLNLIKGTRSVKYERLENTEDIDDVEHQIEKLKSKVSPIRRHKELFKLKRFTLVIMKTNAVFICLSFNIILDFSISYVPLCL